jgi:predicted enzyme related to lactoylglutathione lyase
MGSSRGSLGFMIQIERTHLSRLCRADLGYYTVTWSMLAYLSCENCATEESCVEAAGGKVCKPTMSIGQYGFMALVMDTERNMIGLHSMTTAKHRT